MKSLYLATLLVCGATAIEQPPVEEVNGNLFQPMGAGAGAGDVKKVPVEHPEFEPYPDPEDFKHAALVEQFAGSQDDIFSKWKISHAKKEGSEDEFSYVGKWAVEEPYMIPGFKNDQGLVLKTPAAHHAISRTFEQPLVLTDKPLVVQYEVKFQDGLQCGGAYVKLIGPEESEFSNATPYVVMFGPDKCGATDKVHLIIKRQVSGEWVEHHLTMPPRTEPGKLSSLYTLVIDPTTQAFEVRINGIVHRAGSLVEEGQFRPAFTAPKEVVDVEDVIPEDWVLDETIPDPAAVKPEDWDEEQPFFITDASAVKPEAWLDDEPEFIPDPTAVKPANWDDEEDGEWIAPEVLNPACEEFGCGEWVAPQIKNPLYVGEWYAPEIPNPEYKGEWKPRTIPNPNYYEDPTPGKLDPISGVGLELWTMQANILFDNFYVGESVWEAELLGNATWGPKYYVEQKELKNTVPPANAPKQYSHWDHFTSDPVEFFETTFNDVKWQLAQDPMGALRDQPIGLAVVGGVLIVGFTLFFGLLNALLFSFGNKQLAAAKPAKAVTLKDEKERAQVKKEAKQEAKASGSESANLKKRA